MTGFGDAFLNDYFAECDEHLAAIRQALLTLEGSVGVARPAPAVIEELFRGYHSLKGLAGMVEDRHSERLAHEMEGYLRAIREGEITLTTAGVERLIDGTRTLEETVGALHHRRPPPGNNEVVELLRQLLPAAPSDDEVMPAGAGQDASTATECVFTPSPELHVRGVNVDSIRARLRELGEIVSATPQVTDGGGVAFRFLVAARVDPAVAEAWRRDGLQWIGLAEPAAVAGVAHPDADVSPGASSGHFVRVDLARLDDLMTMIGDLVILRARLADALGRSETFVPAPQWRDIQENAAAIERQLRDLRNGVMRVRLVPVGEIFRRMPFVVRDLARDTDRRVQVVLAGQETQIDKYLVERMMAPIVHLVRNAVSHGLEPIAERDALGKPPTGTISLNARTAGETVTLEIADDGRGIDAGRVRARAAQLGLNPAAGTADEDALLDLICSPGFSTREQSDRASGRGFGMAVVRRTVQDLGGYLRLASTPGVGTTFTIELPLTLAIADALIATVGTRSFAVPQSAVRGVVEITESAVRVVEGGEVVLLRGEALTLIRLSSVLGISALCRDRCHALIVRSGGEHVGVVVDRVVSQREIVVRTTTDPLIRVPGIAGATDLGDGVAVLILDIAAIARQAKRSPLPHRQSAASGAREIA